MEEMNHNTLELDGLRQQMTLLKEKLDKQEIVNDRLMRQAMSSKMSWIKKYIWFEIAIVPVLLLLFAAIHTLMQLSWWLYAFLAIGLIVDVVADYRINRIDKNELLSGNLVEACSKLVRMKRLRAIAFGIPMPLLLVWLAWFLYELMHSSQVAASEMVRGMAAGGFVGGIVGSVIGLFIGIMLLRKMQRTNDDVINQIRALNPEN